MRLLTPVGSPVTETGSDATGRFEFASVAAGTYRVAVSAVGFAGIGADVTVKPGEPVALALRFEQIARRAEAVTVSAAAQGVDLEHPDPSEQIHVRDELLDANPGRPGAPVSIPGLPIETASGGIKAPQYFAPGVAGDHGEPIAQYFQVGAYLVPNNLSANAHGNGYADPNVMIAPVIETVETDGGAFNVREGDHSVNVAATYGFLPRLEPFVDLTGDSRDVDVVAGWSPGEPPTKAWVVVEASYGNGFLDTLEHRQQYKLNGYRVFDIGRHELTLFGIGYYGWSMIPGLVPLGVPGLHDTIDPRQKDQTHTGLIAVNDIWHLDPSSDLQLSSMFRTYNLALYSNFGDGLIRQSEFRTVAGANATYVKKVDRFLSIMAGFDSFRDAPRRLDLDHYLSTDPSVYGPFVPVTANNVTIGFLTPYVAIDGRLTNWLRYDLGWRRDQIDFVNQDLLHPLNSYQKWVGLNSPKATLSLVPPEESMLPSVAFSFGQAFFTNDPRIGTGTQQGTPVSQAHSLQLVVDKKIEGIDLRVTLGRLTQEATLGKIDPDTGLQYDLGPSRNRFVTVAARRYFGFGMIQASVSKADARDLSTGGPVPEAPRFIADFLGTADTLPLGLHGRVEFEDIGSTPLGDGFNSVPIRELRGALTRQLTSRIEAGVEFLIASGYTGQTTEVLAVAGQMNPFEQVVGVYLPSYVTLTVNYRLGHTTRP